MKHFCRQYFFNILLGLDQFVNVLLLGDPDDSISGRTGRAFLSGHGRWFVKPLKLFVDKAANVLAGQTNHCIDSIEPEENLEYELWSWSKDGTK
jgi:hypothetical protein